jgi:hypothetical protein
VAHQLSNLSDVDKNRFISFSHARITNRKWNVPVVVSRNSANKTEPAQSQRRRSLLVTHSLSGIILAVVKTVPVGRVRHRQQAWVIRKDRNTDSLQLRGEIDSDENGADRFFTGTSQEG